jgi:serine/threonine protein kinase
MMELVLFSASQNKWKIADLGLTVEGQTAEPLATDEGRGTPGYHAPELVIPKSTPKLYTSKLDIWGLGCIIYELATGLKTFEETSDIIEYAKGGDFPRYRFPFHGHTAQFLYDRIAELLCVNPNKRPDANEVLENLNLHSLRDQVRLMPYTYSLQHKYWLLAVGEDLEEIQHVRLLKETLYSTTHLVSVRVVVKLIAPLVAQDENWRGSPYKSLSLTGRKWSESSLYASASEMATP